MDQLKQLKDNKNQKNYSLNRKITTLKREKQRESQYWLQDKMISRRTWKRVCEETGQFQCWTTTYRNAQERSDQGSPDSNFQRRAKNESPKVCWPVTSALLEMCSTSLLNYRNPLFIKKWARHGARGNLKSHGGVLRMQWDEMRCQG